MGIMGDWVLVAASPSASGACRGNYAHACTRSGSDYADIGLARPAPTS
jgi:hypothetical protein